MILDIIIIILLIIYVLIGRKRGFVLEFIHLFKYILIIYITRLIYEIIKINNKNLNYYNCDSVYSVFYFFIFS